jgi:Calcineurin-like phosphoesterase
MPYAEVLTESYVLTRLDLVHEALERHLASGRGSVQLGDESISEDDLRAARDAIGARLRDPEVLRPADEDPGSAPLAYLPRDPIVSCVQHGLERAADKRAGRQLQLVTPAPGREDAVADFDPTEALPAVTDRHIPDAGAATPEERITIDPGSFNPWPEDPIWAAALAAALGWRLIHGRHPFNPTPAVARLADRARIYLLSDWGTGIPRAVAVSRAIRNMLNDCGPGVEQHVIHLGDVYYAGWPSEQRNHVLNVWPVPAGESTLAASWAVNGNHDMYSGGFGYFETVLGEDRFSGQKSSDGQATSCFELSNQHWMVLGLDTAWQDHDLADPQLQWIKDSILRAESAGQNVVLLSHHQLFTAFGHMDGPQIADKLGPFLRDHPVRVWFWGHEHRCTVYRPAPEVEHARCIGNGGVPSYATGSDAMKRPDMVDFDFEEDIGPAPDGHRWRAFAFVCLEFDGAELRAEYRDERGEPFRTESL